MFGRGPSLWRHPIPPPLGSCILFTFLLQELSQRSNSGAQSPFLLMVPAHSGLTVLPNVNVGDQTHPSPRAHRQGVTLGALYWLFMLATALTDRYAQAVKVIQYFQYRPCSKPVHLQTHRIVPLLNTRVHISELSQCNPL